MRRLIPFVLLLAFGCTQQPETATDANRAPATTPASTGYVDTTKDMPFDFVAADFVDARLGWIAGVDAEQNVSTIVRTEDGGATWKKLVQIDGDTLLDIDFADAKNGWAVGAEGVIYHSVDGGVTWSAELPQVMWSPEHSTSGSVVKSKSSPSTSQLTISESIASIFFTDPLNGWAAGDAPTGSSIDVRGLVLGTTDGGKTWTELKDAAGKGAPFAINDIWFVDERIGWAAGGNQENNEEDILLRTTDGGKTWTRVQTGTAQFLRAVQFIDANRGWVVGMTIDAVDELPGPSKILATVDGGRTWKVQLTSPRSFFDVVFVDAKHGWAVGDRAAVWATTDGGATWTQQTVFDTTASQTMTRPKKRTGEPEPRAFRCLFVRDLAEVRAGGEGIILKRLNK